MLDLNKYSGKNKSELLHSSGHARLGFGKQIGSTTNQTFNQRLEQQNRESRTIRGYHHSKVGAQRGSLSSRQRPLIQDVMPPDRSSRQAFNAGDAPTGTDDSQPGSRPAINTERGTSSRAVFKEPSRRNYDPYA